MNLPSRIATARTFFANFSVPCLYIAAAAFLAGSSLGAWGSYKVTRAVFERATLRAQKDLSDFTGQLAQNAAVVEAQAAKRQQEALEQVRQRDDAVMAQIASIPALVARRLQPDLASFRSAVHADPDLEACLRRPMPSGALGVLRREGGASAPEADRGAGAP